MKQDSETRVRGGGRDGEREEEMERVGWRRSDVQVYHQRHSSAWRRGNGRKGTGEKLCNENP